MDETKIITPSNKTHTILQTLLTSTAPKTTIWISLVEYHISSKNKVTHNTNSSFFNFFPFPILPQQSTNNNETLTVSTEFLENLKTDEAQIVIAPFNITHTRFSKTNG